MTAEPKWLQIALAEIGVKETPGPESTPRILTYWKYGQPGWQTYGDEQPWCSVFINWCMAQADIQGTDSPAARSWLTWGGASPRKRGAVIVIHRKSGPGRQTTGSGWHVGLYVSETGTHISLLGGNQSNSVMITRFPLSGWEVVASRWPSGRGEKR